jgi:hypothetical protein
MVNGLPALRVDDKGIHAICCGSNMWSAKAGSATVFINGKAAFRQNDPSQHCGGSGKLVEGSKDVIVGDGGGAGGGSGGGARAAQAAAAKATVAPATAQAAAAASAANGSPAKNAKNARNDRPPPVVFAARWEKDRARFSSSIKLTATCANASGQSATFTVRPADGGAALATLTAVCGEDRVETSWTTHSGPTPDRVVFEVKVGGQSALSGELSFLVVVEGTIKIQHQPAKDLALVLVASGGAQLKGKTDGQGHFRIEDVPAGEFTLRPEDQLVKP